MPTTLPPPPVRAPAVPFDGVYFMVTNYLYGAGFGIVFTAAILALDVGGLRTLIAGDGSYIAAVVLAAGMSLTFAGLYAAVSVMLNFRDKAGAVPDDGD